MNPIINGSPQANILGFQDLSGRPPVYVPQTVATHLPHIFGYAERGGAKPVIASGDAFTSAFGAKTLQVGSKYFNHASVLANTVLGRGNAIMFHRIIPADAKTARLLISADVVKDQIQQYQRDEDGFFKLDALGAKIPVTGAGAKLPGHKIKWVLNRWAGVSADDAFGAVTNKTGELLNEAAEASTVYPILELEASFAGGYGSNIGLRLDVPTTATVGAPLNLTLSEQIKSLLYRFQLVERADSESTAQPITGVRGDVSLDLALSEKATNKGTKAKVSFADRFIQAYQTVGQPGYVDQYGPFTRQKIYKANLEKLLKDIAEDEVEFGTLMAQAEEQIEEFLYGTNLFTGVSVDNVPYYSVEIVGQRDGGLSFTSTSTHWATGGADGTMDDAAFDEAVRSQLLSYGTNGIDLLDAALYPHSCFYDTGFSIDTKLAAATILGRRPDMWIVLSTQDNALPQNTSADESAMAVALRTALRVYPESEIYGTSVCRGIVIGHSGKLLDDTIYDGYLPLTIEFADRCANYMGAGNGIWRPGLGFDVNPNNLITMFDASTVNVTFKSAAVRNRDWDASLVWAQRFDRTSLFWPAVQTVYDDDTSVLNSPITMMAACELVKVCYRVWAELTGRSDLTEEQLIERSNQRILELTNGRFDNRFVIVPETYFTADDTQRGYSWSTKINLYANNMRTVGTYTIVARRMSDLTESAT